MIRTKHVKSPVWCSQSSTLYALASELRRPGSWVREKVVELLSDQGPVQALTNTELIMLTYPRCLREAKADFLRGNYMELVDTEVPAKQKELLVGTVKGVLRAKVGQMTSRAAPEIHFPQDWL